MMTHAHLFAGIFLLTLPLLGGCTNQVQDDKSLGDLNGLAFQGDMSEADLGPFVRTTDDRAYMRVSFFRQHGLQARVRLGGGLEYFYEGAWEEFDGPETEDVSGLQIKDGELTGFVELEGINLNFEGVFNNARTRLEADVALIGSLTLIPWEAEEEVDEDVEHIAEDDTGDTGPSGDTG